MFRPAGNPMGLSGAGPIGKLSRGLRSIIPAAGTLATCAVSVELMLPLIGTKKELGVNLHVTAVGALHASWNCPLTPFVPIMVTVKLAVPPTGIVTAVGDTWPVTVPTVAWIFTACTSRGVVAVMVKGKPPGGSVGGTVTVIATIVPEAVGVADAGLNEHSAPAGKLLQPRFTASSKPPVATSVTCAVAEPPGIAERDTGVALTEKSVGALPSLSIAPCAVQDRKT